MIPMDMSGKKPPTLKEFKKNATKIRGTTTKKLCDEMAGQIVPAFNTLVNLANLEGNDPGSKIETIDGAIVSKACAKGTRKFEKKIGALEFTCNAKGLQLPKEAIIASFGECNIGKKDTGDFTGIASTTACTVATISRFIGDKRISDCMKDEKSLAGALAEMTPVVIVGAEKIGEFMDSL